MKLYVMIHDPNGDRCIEYGGMDEDTVRSLIEPLGLPYDFLTQQEYDAFNQSWADAHGRV